MAFIPYALPSQAPSCVAGRARVQILQPPVVDHTARLRTKPRWRNTRRAAARIGCARTWTSCAARPRTRSTMRPAPDSVLSQSRNKTQISNRVAVVAVGGNALIKDKNKKTIHDQYEAACDTVRHITNMIEEGWNVIITHGNGPQVGFDMRRSELAAHELHTVPLDYCDADTQGAIGYMFERALRNELRRRGMDKVVATVLTLVRCNATDPAFKNPTKPIGSFLDEKTAQQRIKEGNTFIEDSGRGWRRLVPSPIPVEIVEAKAIYTLVQSGAVVIATGGGGIPVVENEVGDLVGTEAVIDKDFASSLLANVIGVDLLLFATAVEKIALNFRTPDELWLDKMTIAEAKQYIKEGHFAPGSMKPKIEACVKFLENGGKQVLVTDIENISRALRGETGTLIVP